jgi:hypothetical protein
MCEKSSKYIWHSAFSAGSSRNQYRGSRAVDSHPDHKKGHQVIAGTKTTFADNEIVVVCMSLRKFSRHVAAIASSGKLSLR